MGEPTASQASHRVAVIGSGVSGLTAAWILSAAGREVTLYEAAPRLGGHADTHRVTAPDGTVLGIDTGFIVHNTRTYPLLTRLFGELGVTVQQSEMSMSVRCLGCGLEYAGQRGLPGVAAGLRQGRGRYLRMLTEIGRFHAAARAMLRRPAPPGGPAAGPSLGEFLAAGRYSGYFVAHFAQPFVAAVWSCAPGTALAYPARYLFAFLDQHGLLSVTGSPPWLTVTGGSARYVELVAKQVTAVRAGVPVTAVRRYPGGAEVRCGDGPAAHYGGVVVATHPDQALALLADPTPAERAALGAFRYSRNTAVLHTGSAVLPARPRVRASWNYTLSSCRADSEEVQVSYYMNRLQRLAGERDYIVTLNGDPARAGGEVLDRMEYAHPVYDAASVAAQSRLPELNDGVTAFAGAYHGWGFHEDGCRSGVAAAASLGARW
jgi:predicted NAD/FAD-binding protein